MPYWHSNYINLRSQSHLALCNSVDSAWAQLLKLNNKYMRCGPTLHILFSLWVMPGPVNTCHTHVWCQIIIFWSLYVHCSTWPLTHSYLWFMSGPHKTCYEAKIPEVSMCMLCEHDNILALYISANIFHFLTQCLLCNNILLCMFAFLLTVSLDISDIESLWYIC